MTQLADRRPDVPILPYQLRIVRMQARDLMTLQPPFRRQLVRAFDDLGDRAARAYRAVTLRRAVRQVDPGDAPFVDAITESMAIDDWEQTHFAPAYRTQYLRTLHATTSTIALGMGLGVNLPDEAGRRIIREGGLRVGLADIKGRARTSLFHAMAEGRAQGLAREPLAAHIKSRVTRGPWRTVEQRAQVIARTETAHAQRRSAVDTYRSMDNLEGVRAFDARAGATDADCEQRDGLVFDFGDADIITGYEHPNGTLTWAPQRRRTAPAPASPGRSGRGGTPRIPGQGRGPRSDPPDSIARRGFPQDQARYSQADWDSIADEVTDPELFAAIERYQGSGGDQINAYLRGQSTDIQPRDLRAIERLTRASRTHTDELAGRAVFRGEVWDEGKRGAFRLRTGDTYDFMGFTSTTGDAGVANRFVNSIPQPVAGTGKEVKRRISWEIRNAGEARATAFPNFAYNERELMFVPGMRVKVIDVLDDVTLPALQGETANRVSRHIVAEVIPA